jgi:hypothetical protein
MDDRGTRCDGITNHRHKRVVMLHGRRKTVEFPSGVTRFAKKHVFFRVRRKRFGGDIAFFGGVLAL